MAQGKKLTKQEEQAYKDMYLETLRTLNGLQTITDIQMKDDHPDIDIRWDTARYKWLKEDDHFRLMCDTIKKNVINVVENAMFRKINEGDTQMIKFYLERKGDYTEKKQQVIDINTPVKINIIKPTDESSKNQTGPK